MAKLTKEELEQNGLMSLKVLENSYIMYENSKKDLKENAPKKVDNNGTRIYSQESINKNLELMETMQKDIIEKYIQLGGTEEQLKSLKKGKEKKNSSNRKLLEDIVKKETAKEEWAEYIAKMKGEQNNDNENVEKPEPEVIIKPQTPKIEIKQEVKKQEKVSIEIEDDITTPTSEKVNFNIPENTRKMFDVIKLPSRGQCYKSKKDNIKVSYLTAYDENMILSPNLYKEGSFFDYLLKEKIIDNDFNPEDLTVGDRDAIIVWLRATGYGNEYPIIVKDDETGKEFETTVDLSKLNYKPFKLKGDSNGYFEFEMPISKDIVKFKFLSIKENKILKQQKLNESKKLNNNMVKNKCDELLELLVINDVISDDTKLKVKSIISKIKSDIDTKYDEKDDIMFTHELTDRLLLQTVSVNGISDRKYINDYVLNMNIKDAASYRKYINDNEPSIDFNVEIERPKSLGGGSMKSFLRLDQFIFINV